MEWLGDLRWLLDVTGLAVAALALVCLIVVSYFGSKVVTLLGNHVLHALGRQEDLLKEISGKLNTAPAIHINLSKDKDKDREQAE